VTIIIISFGLVVGLGLARWSNRFTGDWQGQGVWIILFVNFSGLLVATQPIYQIVPWYILALNLSFIWLLILIAVIDFYTRLIYPSSLLVGLGLTLLAISSTLFLRPLVGVADGTRAIYYGEHLEDLNKFTQLLPLNWLDSLTGLILLGGLFGLVYLLSLLVYHKEAFGLGDALLAGVIGSFLGFFRSLQALPLILLLSLVTATLLLCLNIGKKKTKLKEQYIAYAPFLCGGAIWVLVIPVM
jgi:prepilin signal peptidase PulO-like enzyme (type II secretory pathway)